MTCWCGAYGFPHRETGGRCDGSLHVERRFEAQMWGTCRACNMHTLDDEGLPRCQVLDGLDSATLCEAWDDHVRESPAHVWRAA